MSLLGHLVEHAMPVALGAVFCYLLLWWKDHNFKQAKLLEADALVTKAQADAEMLVRDARLAANEEALKLRAEVEQSFAARRAERAELESRLAEREALINSQLERLVEAEKTLKEQKEGVRARAGAVTEQETAAAELGRSARE
jgi:ribonucrease Y